MIETGSGSTGKAEANVGVGKEGNLVGSEHSGLDWIGECLVDARKVEHLTRTKHEARGDNIRR